MPKSTDKYEFKTTFETCKLNENGDAVCKHRLESTYLDLDYGDLVFLQSNTIGALTERLLEAGKSAAAAIGQAEKATGPTA